MEQRKHPRKPADHPVRLVRQGRVVAVARAVNISKVGIAIEVSEVRLESGDSVEVDFYRLGYPRGVSYSIHAEVIHVGPQFMGLMFDNNDPFNELVE